MATTEKHIDPVCGMTVDPPTAAASLEHDGRTYYFCATGCKAAFEKHPDRYTDRSGKKKGIWQRYLERLNKATGGNKPSCCH